MSWPIKNRGVHWGGVVIVVAQIYGCANHYACDKFPDNHCENMSTVYAKTGSNFVDYRILPSQTASTSVQAVNRIPTLQIPAPGQPLLSPDHVLRVWISPWIDQEGDLNSGYVFVHLHTGQWSVVP
ncbi:MAG: TraV family lipoprotein [Pseudomonadales bacterium]|nr:TraV family lipoprotein [Pseudomonadales bacterium]